jgi:hypothetical protein
MKPRLSGVTPTLDLQAQPSVIRTAADASSTRSRPEPLRRAAGHRLDGELDPDLALVFAPVTLEPSLKAIPCLVSERWKVLAVSSSTPGVMRSRNSTTVTFEPSRRQTEPSSSPITPAPITIRLLGTSGRASAPVESTIRFWSTVDAASGAGSEPVAMTMFLAPSVVTAPSAAVTSTLPGPAIGRRP